MDRLRIATYGMWHLGCVTAACLAEADHAVIGLDPDDGLVEKLKQGQPPLHEPGLAELIRTGLDAGNLHFTTSPAEALADADVLWVTFDTPVNDQDVADVAYVRQKLDSIADSLPPGLLVLISSQVPVGFTRSLEEAWTGRGLRFAVSPENLRLGKALDVFRNSERVIVGFRDDSARELLAHIFNRFTSRIEWMSIESAEMTKHAINAFLATSVAFINEIGRLCEVTGADAREVERGLKSEARIGPKAYLSPGAAFAGGTLARDLRFLAQHGKKHRVATPFFKGVVESNDVHKGWVREHIYHLLAENERPVVAMLGLTYKPGTSTLRRSTAIDLCHWLNERGVIVQAHDPAIAELPEELRSVMKLTSSPTEALNGADLAIVATEWPEFRLLRAEDVLKAMNQPCIIDPSYFLATEFGRVPGIKYIATGRAA